MNFDPNTGQPINNNYQQPVNNNYQQPTNQPTPTNGFAIAGLLCSIIVGSILGLIFSIIGLNKSKQMGGSGKGLAIAGIIISALRFVLLIIIFISAFFTASLWPSAQDSIANRAQCMAAYDCIDLGNGYSDCKYIDENYDTHSIQCPTE